MFWRWAAGRATCCRWSSAGNYRAATYPRSASPDPVPEFKLLELPFVVKDRPAVTKALDGELGDYFKRRVRESTPFRVLGFWDNGFRHFSNQVRPIRLPADCRGLRIRTQMSELHGEVFRALGFEPIPADVKEFVAEIATDKFQAQDNPLTNIYNFGVHRYHRYITLSGHFFGASAMAFNEMEYQGWPRRRARHRGRGGA